MFVALLLLILETQNDYVRFHCKSNYILALSPAPGILDA